MDVRRLIGLTMVGVMLWGNGAWAAQAQGQGDSPEAVPAASITKDQEKANVVVAKEINKETELVIYQVQIPAVQGLNDPVFQEQFNQKLLGQALAQVEEVESLAKELAATAEKEGWEYRTHEIFIDFAVQENHSGILSLVVDTYMYTGGANGILYVDCYNLDPEKNTLLRLEDLFKEGADYREVLNQEIRAQIEEQEAREGAMYFPGESGFQTVSADQDFYLQDDQLVILFQKYEIAPGVMGTPQFKIPLAKIYPILQEQYQPKYLAFTGLVKKIVHQQQNTVLWLENTDGQQAHFILSGETVLVGDAEITVGATVKGYYDASLPMIMIYPPRYHVELLEVMAGAEKDLPPGDGPDLSSMDMVVNKKAIPAPKAYTGQQGVVMVPLRAVSEALGVEVHWHPEPKSVSVGQELTLTPGQASYRQESGGEFKLEAAPEIIQGRVFVPLSFFQQALNLERASVEGGQIVIGN